MDKGIKLQAYKQRHGHDINGVRPVMIPDESGEWVSRHDAEHLAEQLQRALSRIAELEAGPHHNGMMQLSNELAEMKRSGMKPVVIPQIRDSKYWNGIEIRCDKYQLDVIEAIRAAGGNVEGSE